MSLHKFIAILIVLSISTLSAETLRIMPLGDSITYDNNHNDEAHPRPQSKRFGYRGPLWKMLKDTNVSFDFVGTRHAGQDYAAGFDPDNEGYPGQTSKQIAAKTYSLLQKNNPNAILLHIGTNDYSSNIGYVEKILNWVDTYEDDTNSKIHVILALIIERRIPDKHIEGFNKNLVKLFDKRWKNGDMITLVDMYRGAGMNNSDYIDRTHPNPSGYTKMAKMWYKALTSKYVAYSSAPLVKDDTVKAQTGATVTINVTANDKDLQNDMDRGTVSFVGGKDTNKDTNNDKLTIKGQGTWKVNKTGIVTFVPQRNFTADPSPVSYTVKDKKGQKSKPAKITINYTNASLESFPTTLVGESYIESVSIDEASNSVTFITRVPNTGITF